MDYEHITKLLTRSELEHHGRILAQHVERMNKHYVSENVMIMWGDDFRFSNAENQFRAMEQLLNYMRQAYPQFHIQFATISEYLDRVRQWSNEHHFQFPRLSMLEKADFFPYVDSYPFDYWSGYYSLRPDIKLHTREAESALRALESLVALLFIRQTDKLDRTLQTSVQMARRTVALMSHHDAITGTHSDRVHAGYNLMLQQLQRDLTESMQMAMDQLLMYSAGDNMERSPSVKLVSSLNHQVAPVSLLDNDNDSVTLILFNPLSWDRTELVKLLVEKIDNDMIVQNSKGETITSQWVPHFTAPTAAPTWYFVFSLTVQGFTIETVHLKRKKNPQHNHSVVQWLPTESIVELNNRNSSFGFSGKSGSLMFVTANSSSSYFMSQSYVSYHSLWHSGFFTTGVYIFRMNWGIWLLIGFGIGYGSGCAISYVLHILFISVHWLFQIAIFYKRAVNNVKNMDTSIGFLVHTFAALIGFFVFHFSYRLVSDRWHYFIMHSMMSFGIPVGFVLGVLVNWLGGWRRIISFAVIAIMCYFLSIMAYPSWVARPTVQPSEQLTVLHIKGPLVQEVCLYLCNSDRTACAIVQRNRVLPNKNFLEVTHTILPRENQDIATRIQIEGRSTNKFFTDANNYRMVPRAYHSLLPIQASYFPICSTVELETNRLKLRVLSSQPLGITAFGDSTVELQLHRHPMQDDERGLDAPIHEQSISQVSLRLSIVEQGNNNRNELRSKEFDRMKDVLEFHHPFLVFESRENLLPRTVNLLSLGLLEQQLQQQALITLHNVELEGSLSSIILRRFSSVPKTPFSQKDVEELLCLDKQCPEKIKITQWETLTTNNPKGMPQSAGKDDLIARTFVIKPVRNS